MTALHCFKQCGQRIYMLRILRSQGLLAGHLNTVFTALGNGGCMCLLEPLKLKCPPQRLPVVPVVHGECGGRQSRPTRRYMPVPTRRMKAVVNAPQEKELRSRIGQRVHAVSIAHAATPLCLCITDTLEQRVTLGLTTYLSLITVKVSVTTCILYALPIWCVPLFPGQLEYVDAF